MKIYSINELRQKFISQQILNVAEKEIYFNIINSIGYFLIDYTNVTAVSNTENQVLLNLIKVIKQEKEYDRIRLYIIFTKEFEIFSASFISTLFLFKNISPDKKVEISIYGIFPSRGILTLIQNLYAGYLSFGFQDFFSLYTSTNELDHLQKWAKEPSDGQNKVSPSKYTISSAFSPLTLISNENFNQLFEEDFNKIFKSNLELIGSLEIPTNEKFTEREEQELYQILRLKIIGEIEPNNKFSLKQYQEGFYLLHYYKFLANYRLLFYTINDSKNKEVQLSYFALFSKFIDDTHLLNKPITFILLFSLIGNEIFDYSIIEIQKVKGKTTKRWNIRIEEDTNQEIINRLYSLFNFVCSIFDGLYELAKNIIQHSEYQLGVLTMRILKKTDILQLKDDNQVEWNNYLDSVEEVLNDNFIDISIVDIGTQGIFTTYEKGLETLLNNKNLTTSNEKIIQRDLSKVKLLKYYSDEDIEAKWLYRFFSRSFLNEKQKIITHSSYGTNTFLNKLNEVSGAFCIFTNKYNNSNETIGFIYHSYIEKLKKLVYLNNGTPFGTSYTITIPIKTLHKVSGKDKNGKEIQIGSYEKKHMGVSTSIYSKMLKTKISQGDLFSFEPEIISVLSQKEASIISLNCSSLNNLHIDFSDFTRYLGFISGDFKLKNKALVLYNLSFDHACKLWLFLYNNRSSTTFWPVSKNSVIQIFYNPRQPGNGYYNSFFLMGHNRNICEQINTYIGKNHYNKLPEIIVNQSKKPKIIPNIEDFIPDNHPLFLNKTAIFTELFIINKTSGLTYFEENAKTLLLTPIGLGGFNMQNIHLRIGSKIHLKDFIVAKRFFQNNNYSTGFAFLMAKSIFQNILLKDKYEDKLKDEYVILGYGYYSELMVSRTEDFLKEIVENLKFDTITFSHFIVEDSQEMKAEEYLSIYKEKINQNKLKNIIIVPISSTLTTQLEIENKFTDFLNSNSEITIDIVPDFFAEPYFTVTVVGDESIDLESAIRKEYWTIDLKDERTIISRNIKKEIGKDILRNKNVSERINKYLIYLPSKWYYPDNCVMCGLNCNDDGSLNITGNKPLFIADKVSVTPSLIWNLPLKNGYKKDSLVYINKDKSITIDECNIDSSMIQQIHRVGTNKHFNFYINYLRLFNSNLKGIKNWVINISINHKKDILLITPEKSSNGPFVNLINKELFNDKADIMNFSPSEIAIEDFLIYFKSDINYPQRTIYYVDNLLATGSNFFSVNNFLLSFKKLHGLDSDSLRFSGIITLIDRLDEKDRFAVDRTLSKGGTKERIHSFVRFNLPVISTTNKQKITCHLCEEETKYLYILKNCNLDCIKLYVRDNNLKKVSKSYNVIFNSVANDREILRFAIAQKLMNLYNSDDFRIHSSNPLSSFVTYVKNDLIILTEDSEFENELKISILKVLSNPPFINYKDIKSTVFKWVYDEIIPQSLILADTLKAENIKEYISSIHYFKVLIKLASKLQINFLVSKDFLIASNKIVHEFEKNKDFGIRKEIQSLKIFITSCIKELLNFNPHLCIVLEKEIESVSKENIFSKKYFDLLILENTEIISKAIEIHNKTLGWNSGSLEIDNWFEIYNNTFDELCLEISKLKGINDFINVYPEISTKEALKKSYLNTVILDKYLETIKVNNENHQAYQPKIDNIVKLLSNIIGLENNGGACFIYRDSGLNDNKAIVISRIGKPNISKSIIDNWEGSYCEQMMKGLDYDENSSKHYYWSSAPFVKTENSWIDNFGEKQPGSEKNELIFGREINRLYFLRLSDWEEYTGFNIQPRCNAILIFYDKSSIPFDSKHLRFAIFIRDKISLFVKENFTQNTAFWGWVENNQKVEEFKSRYRKNTHGVYDKINSKMNDLIVYNDSELLEIFTDLIIGKFHYNLLSSDTSINDIVQSGFTINQVINSEIINGLSNLVKIKAEEEHILENEFSIRFELSGNSSKYSIGTYLHFIVTALIMNAIKYRNSHNGTIITIANDIDFLYISNTNSNEIDFLNAERIINSETVPYESISLYVINKYFEKEYSKSIKIGFNKEHLNTFTVRLPITKK